MQVQDDYSTAVHKQRKLESYLAIGVYIVEIVAYCARAFVIITNRCT